MNDDLMISVAPVKHHKCRPWQSNKQIGF